MKHSRIVFLSLMLVASQATFAQKKISLGEALKQKWVQIKPIGKGGYQGKTIQLEAKNLRAEAFDLVIEPGEMFISKDTAVQDLIVTEMLTINLPAQKDRRAHV